MIYKLRKRTFTIPALPNSIMFRPSPNSKSPLAGVPVGADRAVDVGFAETEFVSMFATVSLSVVTEAMWPSKSVNPVKLDDALPKVIHRVASLDLGPVFNTVDTIANRASKAQHGKSKAPESILAGLGGGGDIIDSAHE